MRALIGVMTALATMGALLGGSPATATATGPSTATGTATGAAAVAGPKKPAVVEKRVIGKSVKGRKIVAWRVGDPDAKQSAVAMGVMHGDEAAARQLLQSIRDGRKITGIDLWLVPTVNPDGLAARTRKNAHGVDLNRNYPYKWADLDGDYESGPKPKSEPETRAVIRFLNKTQPDRIASFHQPLYGVDTSVPKARKFAKNLAKHLNLPEKKFVCGGVCHGTMTQWYMHRHDGKAVTVEFGKSPSKKRMRVSAPRQLLAALGGKR